jgi:hypothetical protein
MSKMLFSSNKDIGASDSVITFFIADDLSMNAFISKDSSDLRLSLRCLPILNTFAFC